MSHAAGDASLTQRKHVDPNICLMCHGRYSYENMGVPGPWPEFGAAFQNNCLLCHAAFRTNRHQVNYLKPDAIEALAKEDSDVCYGCHGGRAWYRIGFPYPRHAWPGMAEAVPDWAKDRPAESDARFLVEVSKPEAEQQPARVGRQSLMKEQKDFSFLDSRLNVTRRSFLKSTAARRGGHRRGRAGQDQRRQGLCLRALSAGRRPGDGRHQLRPQLRLPAYAGRPQEGRRDRSLSTDDGRYQENGEFGKDTEAEPQLRGCSARTVLPAAALFRRTVALPDGKGR